MFFQNTKPTGTAELIGGNIYPLSTFNKSSYRSPSLSRAGDFHSARPVQGRAEKLFQALIGALAELSQKFSIESKIGPQHLGDSEDILPMGLGVLDFFGDPFPEHQDPFLVAGGAEITSLAGEGQKNFVLALLAFDAGEAVS
ncbi:MAG: hypothetical protein V3W37_00665 [Candidatus Binatia bacterium]